MVAPTYLSVSLANALNTLKGVEGFETTVARMSADRLGGNGHSTSNKGRFIVGDGYTNSFILILH